MQRSVGRGLIVVGMLTALALGVACRGAQGRGRAQTVSTSAKPPAWVTKNVVDDGRVCGIGMAGPAYFRTSTAPQSLSEMRAIANLAGVFETQVLEAQIVLSTEFTNVMEYQRAVTVAEDVIDRTAAAAESEFWYDEEGVGPLGSKKYTYARSCVPASFASDLKLDPKKVAAEVEDSASPEKVPSWISRIGKDEQGRLCAVGYSEPTFFPEDGFGNVIEDIRAQLIRDTQTAVLSAFTDTLNCKDQGCRAYVEDLTAATTDAVSKNVVVTHFWFDLLGRGPNRHKRTTYGWGCVYPIKAISLGVKQVPNPPPAAKESVKQAAEKMFEELEKMEEKHNQPVSVLSKP